MHWMSSLPITEQTAKLEPSITLLLVQSHHVLTLWYPDHHHLCLWLLHLPWNCFCQQAVSQQTLFQQCLMAAAFQGLHFKHEQRWCPLPSYALAAAAWAQLHRWVARWQRQSAGPCLLTSHAHCLGGPGCLWRASPACMTGTWSVHPPEQKGRSLSFDILSWNFRKPTQNKPRQTTKWGLSVHFWLCFDDDEWQMSKTLCIQYQLFGACVCFCAANLRCAVYLTIMLEIRCRCQAALESSTLKFWSRHWVWVLNDCTGQRIVHEICTGLANCIQHYTGSDIKVCTAVQELSCRTMAGGD